MQNIPKSEYTAEDQLSVLKKHLKVQDIDYFENDALLTLKVYFQFDSPEDADVNTAIDYLINKEKYEV